MATEVIKIVDPDNGSGTNYTSLSAWEAGEQGDLTGARDEIAVAKCRCTGGTADTSRVTIDGWTTDSTRYIQIWTDPAESYRHNGTWQTGNKYRLSFTAAFDYYSALNILDNYVKVIGLQIEHSGGEGGSAIEINAANPLISHCVLRKEGTRTYSSYGIEQKTNAASTSKYYNNIIYNFTTAGIRHAAFYDSDLVCYNNTIVDSVIGISKSDVETIVTYIKNNLIKCTNAFDGTFTDSDTYNDYNSISENTADATIGSHGRYNQTFTFVGATDFHLGASDGGAMNYGTDLSADGQCAFSDDIDGQTRSGTWDIGADECVVSLPPQLLNPRRSFQHLLVR